MEKEEFIYIIKDTKVEKWKLDRSKPSYGYYQIHGEVDVKGSHQIKLFPIWQLEMDSPRKDGYNGIGSEMIWFPTLEKAQEYLKG